MQRATSAVVARILSSSAPGARDVLPPPAELASLVQQEIERESREAVTAAAAAAEAAAAAAAAAAAGDAVVPGAIDSSLQLLPKDMPPPHPRSRSGARKAKPAAQGAAPRKPARALAPPPPPPPPPFPPASFSPLQLRILRKQVAEHTQLLVQVHALTARSPEARHAQPSDASAAMLRQMADAKDAAAAAAAGEGRYPPVRENPSLPTFS